MKLPSGGGREAYIEVVGELRARWNAALRDHCWAIHLGASIHVQAVEMESRALVPELVVNVDDDGVIDGGANGRQRPLSIDANGWAHKGTIWICEDPSDVEIIDDGRSLSACYKQSG